MHTPFKSWKDMAQDEQFRSNTSKVTTQTESVLNAQDEADGLNHCNTARHTHRIILHWALLSLLKVA